ncbi:membrane hypothetical protein [Vibrio crassostreae]|nr:membrane hypothetical protein [Vibrio crassostreae]CAK2338061.1 membrane hypothetical protein [Vibrio crassostreae]CAK2507513.1 membrane hypothetical protein [Vibrio crassostreae]CAK2897957.1 membrane hypothetical protein [Vibrio crassostreae]
MALKGWLFVNGFLAAVTSMVIAGLLTWYGLVPIGRAAGQGSIIFWVVLSPFVLFFLILHLSSHMKVDYLTKGAFPVLAGLANTLLIVGSVAFWVTSSLLVISVSLMFVSGLDCCLVYLGEKVERSK